MTEQEIVNALMGAGAGGGIILAVGKILFQKIIRNLEESTNKIHDVLIRLSAINVKLELLDHHHDSINKIHEIVHKHDRKLAAIHARLDIHDDGKKRNS